MITKFNLTLFLIFIGFCVNAQQATPQVDGPKGLSVIPATVSFNLAQGQTGTAKVQIVNNLPTKKSFNIYIVDWMRDTTGAHIMAEAGTLPRSCAKWVTLDKKLVENLEPGQVQDLTVKLNVPDSVDAVKEMKWCLVVIESVKEKILAKDTKTITAGVQQEFRMGVHIYQTPPSVTEKGVKMLSFTKVPNEKTKYRITCKNTGNTQLDVKSYLELTNLKDPKNKIKVGPKKFPLFPDQKRIVDFSLPDTIKAGKYLIIAAVDGGGDLPLEASQATIELK